MLFTDLFMFFAKRSDFQGVGLDGFRGRGSQSSIILFSSRAVTSKRAPCCTKTCTKSPKSAKAPRAAVPYAGGHVQNLPIRVFLPVGWHGVQIYTS